MRSFETAPESIGPGATVWFKVIEVDDDGNQTGSSAAEVTRGS